MSTLTFDRTAITPRAVARAALHAALLCAVVLAAATVLSDASGHTTVEVLRSALQKQSKAPENAEIIEQGLATIQGNWYWFLLITFPVAFAVLIGAVGLGVKSASDWLFRLVMALVGIIAFAPAIIA